MSSSSWLELDIQEMTSLLHARSKHLTDCIEANREDGELSGQDVEFIGQQVGRLLDICGHLKTAHAEIEALRQDAKKVAHG